VEADMTVKETLIRLFEENKGNYISGEEIAQALGMTIATFNYKVNNKREFKASEIKKLSEHLSLTAEEVNTIFFAEEVE